MYISAGIPPISGPEDRFRPGSCHVAAVRCPGRVRPPDWLSGGQNTGGLRAGWLCLWPVSGILAGGDLFDDAYKDCPACGTARLRT